VSRAKNGFVFGLGLLSCFALGFAWRDIQNGELPSARAVNGLLGVKTSPNSSPEQVFKVNYNRILTDYVRPVKPLELKYAGMEGLMAALGDPHTMFLPPRAAQMFSDETRANFGGVGAKLQADPLGAKVATVFEDGPAFAAGLRKGNIIIAVDGKSVSGKDTDYIVSRVKGKEGTTVRLTVIQGQKEKPAIITIKRARIVTPTVEGKFFPDSKVGYLTVSQFAEPTSLQFDRELEKLERGNDMKGLVIDVRGNPGGLLETAKEMLSRFVDGKVVVKMRFRDGSEQVERASNGGARQFDYPVVVLMDENSASAAEIFAGVLKDYGKASLVGTHSYGKASVQNVFPLLDHSSAKITIAKYYLPFAGYIGRKVDEDGVYISGGLEPDVKVEVNTNTEQVFGEPATDNQLKKAIEVVRSKNR